VLSERKAVPQNQVQGFELTIRLMAFDNESTALIAFE
jgi:hypothetical protein